MLSPLLRLLLSALAASLSGGFGVGWQAAVGNSLAPVLMPMFNESLTLHYSWWSATETNMAVVWATHTMASSFGGALGAAFMAPCFANKFGRRRTLIMISWLMIPVLLLSVAAPHPLWYSAEMLTLSRLLMGVLMGCGQSVGGTYISEVAPAHLFGRISLLASVIFWLAYVLGCTLCLQPIFGSPSLWPLMFAINIAVVLVQLALLLLVAPESPNYLVSKGRSKEATDALKSVNDRSVNVGVLLSKIEDDLSLRQHSLHIGQLFTTGLANRRAAILAIMFGGAMPLSAAASILTFSTSLFIALDYSSTEAALFTVGSGSVALLATLSTSLFIDRINRRTVILSSTAVVLLCVLALTVLGNLYQTTHNRSLGYAFVLIACAQLVAYSAGLGPVCWFIATELVPANGRAANQALAMTSLHVTGVISVFTFWTLRSHIGYYVYLINVVAMASVFMYSLLRLPETRGRPLCEVQADLRKRTIYSHSGVGGDLQLRVVHKVE